jgi:type IV pilus assembly protein PilC
MTSIPDIPAILLPFEYTAQTYDGRPVTGTIDAADLDDASRRLTDLRLRIIRLDPSKRPARSKPLNGEDFALFNQQLAHLAVAGLPIEQGLRLIAEDLQAGGLAQSIRDVAGEMERGVPLADAFQRHEKQFPSLYSTLIDAGVRTGNLSGVLLNLGRHLELVNRLRAAIWRSAAYPLTVVAGLLCILLFLAHFVMPQFQEIYRGWMIQLPAATRLLFALMSWVPLLSILAIIVLFGYPVAWTSLRTFHLDRAAADLALPIPLIGPILHKNLIARWCDAMRLGVEAGIDLPAAVQLACTIIGSPALSRDCKTIIGQLTSGQSLDSAAKRLRILPPPVLAVVQTSADRNDLPHALATLSAMYQQQADMRLSSIQALLTPALIIGVGIVIGFVVVGLFSPLIALIQAISSPM